MAFSAVAALMAALVAAPVVSASEAAPAAARVGPQRGAAAVTVGQALPAGASGITCSDFVGVQIASGAGAPSYTAPGDGVVTSFTHNAGPGTGQVRGLFYRTAATPDHLDLVGKSALVTLVPGTPMTFPARFSVQAGDFLAIQVKNTSGAVYCVYGGVPGDAHELASIDPDTSATFPTSPPIGGNRWNISAVVEPDVDKDGFGDVSQDQCPELAQTQVSCPAPDTLVTKAPKKSVTKRKVTIAFSSSLPGSTFTCTVDGKPARTCSSPFKKRFGFGKHRVLITAIGPSGRPDPTPALVKFRIKRPV